MSIHKECGEEIVWLRKPDDVDKYLPPMEYVGPMYFKTEGPNGEVCGIQATAYKMHRCDPDKMEAWIEYKERIAEISEHAPEQPVKVQREAAKQKKSDWVIARERKQANIRTECEAYVCRRCDAVQFEPCYNLTIFKRTHEKVPINMPHPVRQEDAGLL